MQIVCKRNDPYAVQEQTCQGCGGSFDHQLPHLTPRKNGGSERKQNPHIDNKLGHRQKQSIGRNREMVIAFEKPPDRATKLVEIMGGAQAAGAGAEDEDIHEFSQPFNTKIQTATTEF